jgi:predicted CXXCH cytochrome family protein
MRPVSRQGFLSLLASILVCIMSVVFFTNHAAASQPTQQPSATDPWQSLPDLTDTGPIISNDTCLGCHGQPGLVMTVDDGEELDLYVDPDAYAASIHGKNGYACVQCHTNLGNYPHPEFIAADLRDVTLQLNEVCYRCHSGELNLTMDSVHAAAQIAGIREAAVCTDCHGSHDVHQWTDPETHAILPDAQLSIPVTCSKCHSAIYQKYRNSVHGAALTDESNTDVPTCISCHGVHNIPDPTTAAFRLNSPQLCAGCHTDPKLMDKYGISTDVLNTYVADFHGTTVTLFEKQSPDAQTNKPVCYDCHGVHDISKVDDPKTGLLMQENLLVRCKVCHPDATINFPSAWMSHYIPSPTNYSLVYYVNLFYKIFIPLVLGGMVALVGMDVGHTVYVKSRRAKKTSHETKSRSIGSIAPDLSDDPDPVEPGEAIANDKPDQSSLKEQNEGGMDSSEEAGHE